MTQEKRSDNLAPESALIDAVLQELREGLSALKTCDLESDTVDQLLKDRDELSAAAATISKNLPPDDPRISQLFDACFDHNKQNILVRLSRRFEENRVGGAGNPIELPQTLTIDDWHKLAGGISEVMSIYMVSVMIQPYLWTHTTRSRGNRRRDVEDIALELLDAIRTKGLKEHPLLVDCEPISRQVHTPVKLQEFSAWVDQGLLPEFYKPYVQLWRRYLPFRVKSLLNVPFETAYLDEKTSVALTGDEVDNSATYYQVLFSESARLEQEQPSLDEKTRRKLSGEAAREAVVSISNNARIMSPVDSYVEREWELQQQDYKTTPDNLPQQLPKPPEQAPTPPTAPTPDGLPIPWLLKPNVRKARLVGNMLDAAYRLYRKETGKNPQDENFSELFNLLTPQKLPDFVLEREGNSKISQVKITLNDKQNSEYRYKNFLTTMSVKIITH